jgi:dTDP-glucose 4,6-dehydratase
VDGGFDAIVHFAAESHVDRSILSPHAAIDTNVRGTATLLEAARAARVGRFLHVSTDEVYGDIDEPFEADETFPLRPSSPYAASKAASDLLALAYVRTYGLPVIVTRASNNYGPYQFPEKLIPLMISNAIEQTALPVYGDGLQIRDWLYVDDHCRALLAVLERGREGEVYNVAGACHLPNIEVIQRVLKIVGAPETLIRRVTDRPGHDRRYALRGDKLARETGFRPEVAFEDGLARTVAWYQENAGWIGRVRSGEYREYYSRNYAWRAAAPEVSPGAATK